MRSAPDLPAPLGLAWRSRSRTEIESELARIVVLETEGEITAAGRKAITY
jgi:hypothetical protein